MQKVAEPSRRGGAVTEYLAQRALAHEAHAQGDQAALANLESQLQQLREQSEQREVELAELRTRLAVLEGAEKKG